MPKSKTDKSRKEKVQDYKTVKQIEKHLTAQAQEQSEQPQATEQQPNQPEPVRQVPVWKSQDKIEMLGIEWEAIFNFINNVGAAYTAAQAVMNRNILNGTIDIDFQKLNDEKTEYVAMVEEEKVPYREKFNEILNSLRAKQTEEQEKITGKVVKLDV